MIGAIVGGGLSAAGSIFGMMKASEAMRRAKRGAEAQRAANRAWYERRFNEDSTRRADAQRLLNLTEEKIRDRNRGAAGTAAVMGAGMEHAAVEKAANNALMADAVARIAAQGDARKDAVEAEYRNKDGQYENQLANFEMQRANALSGAVQGVAGAGAGLASALDK